MNNITYLNDIEDTSDSKNLPNLLIISPGKYVFQGKTYNLEEEGMYRFFQY